MSRRTGPKPTVEYEGTMYGCRSYTVEIPDLTAMDRLGALIWLNRNTVPRRSTRKPNPLAGYPGTFTVH